MQILNDLLNMLVNENLIKIAYIEKPLSSRSDNINLHIIFNDANDKDFKTTDSLEMIKSFLETKSFLSYSSITDNILHFISEDGLSLYLHADKVIYPYDTKVIVYNPLNIDENNEQYNISKNDVKDDMVKALYSLIYQLHNALKHCLENENVLGMFCLNRASDYLFVFLSDYYLGNPKNHSYNYLLTKMEKNKADFLKEIITKTKIESVIDCAKLMIWFIDDYIANLPINVAKEIAIDYYLYVKKQISEA